ncbi:unnamed protein product [Rotaria magnacalcarata]|uniref:Uncharacterized protein n=1 Tax=Rotaria magnacalcarata TaxID=392030 RepID=A0A8S3ELU0_9BILA|nr:unnamed protein product [Rotaria magnacalcarata]
MLAWNKTHASRSTTVYIKRIPFENDADSEQNFLLVLSEYSGDNKPITMEAYRKSSKLISFEAVGIVQKDVYDFVRRPEYGNRYLSIVVLIRKAIPIAFTNIFDRESVIEKHTHGKASITATHIIHQLDESSSGISSQNREDSMNNGFLRSIAWKTQSHSKESKDLNLSSTSLTRRTRAHLKCRNKNKDRPRKPKNDS